MGPATRTAPEGYFDSFRARFFAALAYPDFRRLWAANAYAQAAAWALIVTRGWLIYDKTGSALYVSPQALARLARQILGRPIFCQPAHRIGESTPLSWTSSHDPVHSVTLSCPQV